MEHVEAPKRPPDEEDAEGAPSPKRAKTEGDDGSLAGAALKDAPGVPDGLDGAVGQAPFDDFDALMEEGAGAFEDLLAPAPEPPEEAERRAFAERLASAGRVAEAELAQLLATLRDHAPSWGPKRQWRSVALLLVCVARSTRVCRAAFVAEGLPLLGSLLQEAVGSLEAGGAVERQEAGMWTLACLTCLRALPLGRATLWEHRFSVGKPFDRLHRWCAREKSALAAELRAPTQVLCQRWRRQPRPASQEAAPEQKALRRRVIEALAQGLLGHRSRPGSPASPALPPASPGLPAPLVAAELEAALFGRHGGATPEYRSHARMLRSNLELPGNAPLRHRVLSGDLDAEALVAMRSEELAPDALRAERREAERKVLKESLVHELVPLKDQVDADEGRSPYHWSTAPPLLVSPSKEVEEAETADAAKNAAGGDAAGRPCALPAVQVHHMEPPPTPFRDGHGRRGDGDDHPEAPTPDVLATPAHDEEDEEEAALIRWLSGPV